MDYSQPGFSVYGISQAKILEWVAIPFSTGSSWPRDQTWVSRIAGRFFTVWTTIGALRMLESEDNPSDLAQWELSFPFQAECVKIQQTSSKEYALGSLYVQSARKI